jgi:hypothetical protein
MRRNGIAALTGLLMFGAACGGGGGGPTPDKVAEGAVGTKPATKPAAAAAGKVDPGLTLSDDTVVVDGRAFDSFGDDGKTIRLDGGRQGADELAPGKILLLSGVTVVRVAAIERDGDAVVVTGAPVTLPEVIEDGTLEWTDREVDATDARMMLIGTESTAPPGSQGGTGSGGGGITVPDGEGGELQLDEGDLDLFGLGGGALPGRSVILGRPRLVAGKTVKGQTDEYGWSIAYDPAGRGHHFVVTLLPKGDLTGTIKVDVTIKSLAHSGGATIAGGEVQNFDFEMSDLSGDAVITTDLKGLQNTASLTTPPFFKLPFSIEFPAIVGGIPFTLSVGSTIQVNLAMALANSSLLGKAEIGFGGPAGWHFNLGQLSLDGQRTQEAPNLLDTIRGLAPGPVGIVVTSELPKVGFGFGFLQTGAGVYISNGMVSTQTILPAPAQCTAMNVAYVLAGGVEAKFLGKEFELARKAFVDKRWNYQFPQDQRCNAAP